MTHTPGPWREAYNDENGQAVVSGENSEIATCWHHCVGALEQQMRANARLIAAAPDLLRELADLVDWLTTNQRTIEGEFDMAELLAPARAAIARATTQGD